MANAPPDVLCGVFELLPFAERVSVTHVCKHWRKTSLSFPGTLWSQIVSNGRREGVLRQLLDRSQGAPVEVEVLLWDKTYKHAMAAVSEHLFHIRRLHLYSRPPGEGEPDMDNIPHIYDALAVPAPILEELEIGLSFDDRDLDDYDSDDSVEAYMQQRALEFDDRIPTNLFAGHAPLLRKAAWLSMLLHPDGIPALAGVTRFSFECSHVPAAQLSAIVRTLPSLKALRIHEASRYDLPSEKPHGISHLEELELDTHISYVQSIRPLLQYLGYENVLDVAIFRTPRWLDHFASPPRSLPHTLHLHGNALGLHDWHAEDSAGYTSRGLMMDTAEMLTKPLTRDMFANLAVLVAPLSVLLVDLEDLPELQRLTRLSLTTQEHDDGDRIRMLCREHTPARKLVCPNLRLLDVCGTLESRDKLVVFAEEIESLVRNAFLFGAGGYPHVTLRHVEVAAPLPEHFCGRPISDALAITDEPIATHMEMDTRDHYSKWHVILDDPS